MKILFNDLKPASWYQSDLIEKIIDEALELKDTNLSFAGKDKSYISRFFNGNHERIYVKYMDYFLSCAQKPNTESVNYYEYGTFPLWQRFCNAWEALLNSLSEDKQTDYQKKISKLIVNLQETSGKREDDIISAVAHSIQNENLVAQLATLSMIACTTIVWTQAPENPRHFKYIQCLSRSILPEGTELPDINKREKGSLIDEDHKADERQAQNLLEKAHALIQTGNYLQAGELCEKIGLDLIFAPSVLRGEAFYLLGLCCKTDLGGYKVPFPYKTIEELFFEAKNLGYHHDVSYNRSIIQHFVHAMDHHDGLCTCNAEYLIYDQIKSTIPTNWEIKYHSNPADLVEAGKHLRVVLSDNDFEKNVHDALTILDIVQHSTVPFDDWAHTEIFIRCEEEKSAPLLDTALSLLRASYAENGYPVRVFILDEAKRAAQSLYAVHPLFYPLTCKNHQHKNKSTSAHLVILSDSDDISLASWLVREAFWMLPVVPNTQITVLSPNAMKIRSQISALCPGMADFISYPRSKKHSPSTVISGISFPEITIINTNFDSPEFCRELNKIEDKTNTPYYVIDGKTDLDTLSLGIRVRENNIRCSVQNGEIGLYPANRAVIALHCRSPHFAELTHSLLVPKDSEHGNQWFSDYGFLTFGSLDTMYSWNNLDGGILEDTARCVHLQYCEADAVPGDHSEELSSYFNRLYNRDSSLACAISLPYRLFCAGVVPSCWYIQDTRAYWGKQQRRQLADAFRKVLSTSDSALLTKLSQYEHTRWSCYMLSRGWLSSSVDQPFFDTTQTIQMMKAGASRHMLQIARLHACLCSWDNLKTLQQNLDWEYRKIKPNDADLAPPKNPDKRFESYYDPEEQYTHFHTLDTNNIKMTPEILCNAWLPEKEHV